VQNWKYIIVTLIMIMVASITIYGHFLAMRIRKSEQQIQSASKQLSESNSRMTSILESAADGIITIHQNGKIESINRAACELFGYEMDDVIGKNVKILLPDKEAIHHDQYLKHYLETGRSNILGNDREVVAKKSDGTEFPIELAVSEVLLHEKSIFTGIVRDISERKRLEKIESEFISNVSHELRTPLTAIYGSLKIIASNSISDIPQKAHNLVDMALRNTERLKLLINDILDMQKIESGCMEFSFQEMDLVSLTKEIIESMRAYTDNMEIKVNLLTASDHLYIVADEARMSQVITNLLSNASKFSEKQGEVIIRIEDEEDMVRFSIEDKGRGIPDTFKDRIFTRFAQADSSDEKEHEGTGLGLSIVKEIINYHKGHIWFDSKEGEGTMFFFEFKKYRSGEQDMFSNA
jgi:PAS domain S-box-containing protein